MEPGRSTFTVGSRSTRSPARRSRATRSGTRPSGRSGCTLPPGTTTTRTPVRLGLRDPGTDRSARHVAEPGPVPPELPELADDLFAPRRGAARDRRVGRLLDLARREPVPRFAGDRQLPDLPLRRGRALRRRAIPDRSPTATHRGIQGKSSGGYGADGRADAPTGPLGRAGDARRRCALRDVLPAGVPRDRPDAA